MRTRHAIWASLSSALLLGGCSEYEGAAAEDPAAGETSEQTAGETEDASDAPSDEESDDMGGMDMSMMNEPDATPADEVDGELAGGEFALVDTPPPGFDQVAGDAYLAQNADGTTVTIRLTGLQPDSAYLSHLHERPCAQDAGGDHFAFDPEGEAAPPNEVHLGFTTDGDGAGEATVTNDRRVGDGAPAVVVHTAGDMSDKIACADLR